MRARFFGTQCMFQITILAQKHFAYTDNIRYVMLCYVMYRPIKFYALSVTFQLSPVCRIDYRIIQIIKYVVQH